MASPNIVSVVAVQGTGAYVTQPVVEITVNFTADHNCNFFLELSVDNGSTWHTALAQASGNGLNVGPASNAIVLLDIFASFNQNSFPARGAVTQAQVRLTATDPIGALSSTATASAAFTLKSTLPVVTGMIMPQYVGAALASAAGITLTGHNGDGSTAPVWYRANLATTQLIPGSGLAFSAYGAGVETFSFPSNTPDGSQTLYVVTYDSFYNASALASYTTTLQRTPPNNCSVDITGTTGNVYYTGLVINSDGTFTVNRQVTMVLRASSPLPLTFLIDPTSNVEAAGNVNAITLLNAESATQVVSLTTNPANPTPDNFNADSTVVVNVDFTDAASNTTNVSAAIRLNTRQYQTANSPVQPNSATSQVLLTEISSSGNPTVIPQTMTLSGPPLRIWNDIFYPITHSFPTLGNGQIDTDAAISMNQISNATNDAVLVNNGVLVLDGSGRPQMVDWTTDGTKNYGNMISSAMGNLQYWIIDATGFGNFPLEFEYFDLNPNVYGPPFNNAAPYRGDVLMVYDATTAGALTLSSDAFGQPIWVLSDSTKLHELYGFTGQTTNVVDLVSGMRMNSDPHGGFVTPVIQGIPKILLMFFSDAAGSASGFRLKSSQGINQTWSNYDIDYTNGRLWVHKDSSLGTTQGAADPTIKQLIYNYLTNPVKIDYDAGTVTFAVAPSGAAGNIEADYSYKQYDVAPSGTWISSEDDFVYYDPPNAYIDVSPSGYGDVPAAVKAEIYETDGVGRLSSGITWDMDRGVAELAADHVPVSNQRLFADYQYHTYKRLTNDGYGDLDWHDAIIVADVTPLYPNYTYASLKIINEGNATLEGAAFTFVPRGYDTNNDGEVIIATGSVDQVLNINRPWDFQEGTSEETCKVMAMEVLPAYTFTQSMAQTDAMTILGTWINKAYGDLPAQAVVYGRAVWVLGGPSGTAFPPTSQGPKRTSIQAAGEFYAAIVG